MQLELDRRVKYIVQATLEGELLRTETDRLAVDIRDLDCGTDVGCLAGRQIG